MRGPGRRCPVCDAALGADVHEVMCGSCARAAGFQRPIPDGFYADAALRAALARYDFGPVLTAVRGHTGLSQLQLANLLELSQSRVSAVERGERQLMHVKLAARMSTVLGVPPRLLGFPADSGGSVAGEEVSWLQRRDFVTLVTAAALGSNLQPELARLGALLPAEVEPVTRPRIGAADVEAIETITEAFRRSDLAHGGGLCRAAAITQLHQVRRLHDARCTPQIRTRLLVATAELASMAGWTAYDVDDHDAARRLWTYALDTARRADEHPHAPDLAVHVLRDMAHQALHLDRPDEALQLVQLASATAATHAHPISGITSGFLCAVLGWCRAARGEVEPTRRAIGQAQDTYAAADPATTPPWGSFLTDAGIAAQQGYALYLLSLTRPRFAPEAIENLTTATAGYRAGHARSRAVNLPPLACARFQAGNLDAAVATGHDAVHAITGLSSTRGYARLRVLDTIATPHTRKPEVAELREHIHRALATRA